MVGTNLGGNGGEGGYECFGLGLERGGGGKDRDGLFRILIEML